MNVPIGMVFVLDPKKLREGIFFGQFETLFLHGFNECVSNRLCLRANTTVVYKNYYENIIFVP